MAETETVSDPITVPITSTFRPSEVAFIIGQLGGTRKGQGPFIRKIVLKQLKKSGFKPIVQEK